MQIISLADVAFEDLELVKKKNGQFKYDFSFLLIKALLPEKVLHAKRTKMHNSMVEHFGWRPIIGAPHPEGRYDTYDRFIARVVPEETEYAVVIERWTYNTDTWYETNLTGIINRDKNYSNPYYSSLRRYDIGVSSSNSWEIKDIEIFGTTIQEEQLTELFNKANEKALDLTIRNKTDDSDIEAVAISKQLNRIAEIA